MSWAGRKIMNFRLKEPMLYQAGWMEKDLHLDTSGKISEL